MELLRVIAHAQSVISWQENLVGEEMPPAWMWPFDEEISAWFDRINSERRSKYGLEDTREDPPGVDMMENELARGLAKKGRR